MSEFGTDLGSEGTSLLYMEIGFNPQNVKHSIYVESDALNRTFFVFKLLFLYNSKRFLNLIPPRLKDSTPSS